MLPLFLIITASCLTVIADMYLKKSGRKNQKEIMVGFMLYALIAIPTVLAFKYVQFGVYYLLWEVLTTSIAIFIGTFYFKEKFTSYRFIAILFTLATIFLMYQ